MEPIKLLFAMMADYVTMGANAKPIIVGQFDVVHDALGQSPVPFPPCTLIAKFEAALARGSQIPVRITVTDSDGREVISVIQAGLTFAGAEPGYRPTSVMVIHFQNLRVPRRDDYSFVFWDGETRVGELMIRVVPPPPGPRPNG